MMHGLSQFISDCRTVSSVTELDDLFKNLYLTFGAETGTLSCIGSPSKLLNSVKVVGFSKPEFVRTYIENNFILYDPAAKRSIKSLAPFSWDECRIEVGEDKRALNVLEYPLSSSWFWRPQFAF